MSQRPSVVERLWRAINPTLSLDSTRNEPDATQALLDDACETVDRVQRRREEFYEARARRPDIADVLLAARDREG